MRMLVATVAAALGVTLSLVLGGGFGAAAATGAAPAATSGSQGASASMIFGCRASVSRAEIAGQVVAEPAVANPATTPCNNDSALVQTVGLLGSSSPLNIGNVGPAGASTYETGALGSATSPAATAVANVTGLTLSFGGYTLTVAGPLTAQAAVECMATSLSTQGSSSGLNVITVSGPGLPSGGQQLEIGGAVNQVVANLPAPLAALISITANEQTVTATSLTETLLDIKLLASNVHVVVGEAKVSYPNPAICAENVPGGSSTVTTPGTSTTVVEPSGSVPGTLAQCTDGSVYDPKNGDCVIYANGQTIYVSKPFKGPSGGQIYSLTNAKKHWHSPCFAGPGPKWVLIVTKRGGHAKGTPGSDRILGLGANESIFGLSGNDCIDEHGGGHEVITDMNGNDRAYSVKGDTRIAEGNGNDRVNAEHGGGWITVGNGKDTIFGGKQRERIDVGLNADHIYTYRAFARIYDLSKYGYITCGNRTDKVFARQRVANYAAKHGCVKIDHLK